MPPKPPNPPIPPEFLAELLALRPYIEHIMCDGSRDPRVREAAEDHVQTVMRKVVQHLPSYVPHEDGLRPWVTRIAYNEKVDAQRSAKRHDEVFGDPPVADFALTTGHSPERDAQVRALLAKVFNVIEGMPPDIQDLLVLAAFCEDPHAEIAARLQISEDAAKMRLVRARKMLRKRAGSIREHIGVWLLFVRRKLTNTQEPLLARFQTFCWQTAHLLPPMFIFIGLGTLPQLESMTPTAVVEYANSAPSPSNSLPSISQEKQASNLVTVPITEKPRIITSSQQRPMPARASDKPRRQTQTHRTFDVVLPTSPTIMNAGR